MKRLFSACATAAFLFACGPSEGKKDNNLGDPDASPTETCQDGQTRCLAQTYQTCDNGAFVDTQTCTADQVCGDTGCTACTPGTRLCVGNEVHDCTADGNVGNLVEACSDGLQCYRGSCSDLCKDAEESNSYIGCEYWAVDLDNGREITGPPHPSYICEPSGIPLVPGGPGGKLLTNIDVCVDSQNESSYHGLCESNGSCPEGASCKTVPEVCGLDAQNSPFAVVVSNPQAFPVDVTLTNKTGTTKTVSVGAGAVEKLYPQQLGFPDQSIDGSGQFANAYKVGSTAPIVAYQFNPLDNEDVFSNDGSLLIPRATFDKKYYALSWHTLNARHPQTPLPVPTTAKDLTGYVSIVAWQDNTEIRITPTADTRVGAAGFAGIPANTPQTFTLNAFDVLNFEADSIPGNLEQDLSGTLIEAVGDSTFGVFGGHEATQILDPNTQDDCCADHVEEMMFPTSTWGKKYAVARSASREHNERDLLRIMAQENGTTVSINPAADDPCSTLNAGEFCDVHINGDHVISSDKPILVGHFLLSATKRGTPLTPSDGTGDPSLALAVPVEQFRGEYTFLVPSEYDKQYVSVATATAGSVTLDGADVTSELTEFGGEYKGGRILVQPGQHTIECSSKCGIEIYGYSDAVSYLFAGGLDLQRIVVD